MFKQKTYPARFVNFLSDSIGETSAELEPPNSYGTLFCVGMSALALVEGCICGLFPSFQMSNSVQTLYKNQITKIFNSKNQIQLI